MMHPLWIAVPVLVWAVHFAAIYGFTAFACARALPHLVPWAVAIASIAAAGAAIVPLRRGMRRRDCFSGWMTAAVAAFALLAIVYESTAAYLVPICP